MTTKIEREHVCQDPTCGPNYGEPGNCTLDRWYPNAPLSKDVRETIVFALKVARVQGAITYQQGIIAMNELDRDQ